MNNILKQLIFSVLVAIAFATFQATQCMEEKAQECPSREFLLFQALKTGDFIKEVGCIPDINIHILKDIAALSLLSQPTNEWSVVCKEYPCIMQKHKIEIFQLAICQVYAVDSEICERFLNGRLIYQPNIDEDDEDNNDGKIELRISDLPNPLEGVFDLSQCGDMGNALSISTGYRKGKKPENADKVEIWFVPRFMVEKEINGSASHFKKIFPNNWLEAATVGIIWTLGKWDDMSCYDHLTDQDMNGLSVNDLYGHWDNCTAWLFNDNVVECSEHFHVAFNLYATGK